MISGVGVFFLGCGMTTYHACHALISPEPLANVGLGMGTLAIAGLLEGYSMLVALHEIRREAAKSGVKTLDYIRDSADPLNVGVFLEDAAAVVGVGVAMTALGLSHVTGNPAWDAAGSLLIGGMLGGVAAMIVSKNREILLGQSLAPARTHLVLDVLRADSAVLSLHDVKSVMVSPGVARFKAEVHFNSVAIADRYLGPRAAGRRHAMRPMSGCAPITASRRGAHARALTSPRARRSTPRAGCLQICTTTPPRCARAYAPPSRTRTRAASRAGCRNTSTSCWG